MNQVQIDLRAWAQGNYGLEAATELLIRAFDGRFAEPGYPWITADHDNFFGIDFAAILPNIGPYSAGERRLLAVAASLGGGGAVDLNDAVDMDRECLTLVLAALSHASGSAFHTVFGKTTHEDGTQELNFNDRSQPGPLYRWPQ